MKNERATSVIVAALLLCSLAVFAHAKPLSPQEHLLDLAKAGTFVVNAGSFRVNATLPLGAPLAGYGNRRVKHWPIPEPKEYTTWMQGSEGTMDPNWARAVVIEANGNKICFLTFDGIGADGTINEIAYNIAVGNGFTVPKANCMFSGSHSHSGPGAIASEMLWSLAPATDLVVPSLQRQIAESFAEAMVQAERNMRPANIGIGASLLYNVTHNRRAGISPYVNSTTIDPNLMVLRVDGDDGKPIATLWNYAIHGTCWGPDNMLFSSDIMGGVNTLIESQTGAYSLFINGDAGDISPDSWVCDGKPNYGGAPTIAQAVLDNRAGIKTSKNVSIQTHSTNIDFGPTILNATLARFFNCTTGGPLNICTLCSVLKCVDNAQMPSSWIEDNPVFGAFRVRIDNTQTLFVSMPGEPLVELGNQVRRDSKSLGFDNTFLCGYTNSHMGYFCTPNEYDVGGYESQLTFWGIYTAEKVRSGCFYVASTVRPNDNTLAVTRPPTFLKHLPSDLYPEVLKILNLA